MAIPGGTTVSAQRSNARSTSKKRSTSEPVYYEISQDYVRGGVVGWEFSNYATLQKDHRGMNPAASWPDGYLQLPRGPWRFPDYVEAPRFLISKKLGRPPRDLECIDGIWIISAAMKAVLEAVDPEICEFRRCETVLPSGEVGRETWLCTINRAFVGAVDVQASEHLQVRRNFNGTLSLATHALTRLKLRAEVVGNAHLFHIAEMAHAVYCDQTMKDACKAAGLKGARFREVSKS
jgi:Protein of unknown function (DUF1629)